MFGFMLSFPSDVLPIDSVDNLLIDDSSEREYTAITVW